jgi:ATP-binding cassette subfamily A (ABC1) protein 3
MAPTVIRQTWALVRKNLIINLKRHRISTIIRAGLLPIIYVAFISYARNLFLPPANYGIGTAKPVKALTNVFADHSDKKMVFVNSGLGGEVNDVISTLQDQLKGIGTVKVLQHEVDLRTECKQSLRGVSMCFAAVVFVSSPNTGNNNQWNYTLRGDSAISSGKLDVDRHDNDVQE